MGICKYCGKPLRLIGMERKNGKVLNNHNGKDWKGREYHKKCWKVIQDEKLYSQIYLNKDLVDNTDYDVSMGNGS